MKNSIVNIFLPLSKKENPSTKFPFLKYVSVSQRNGKKDILTY